MFRLLTNRSDLNGLFFDSEPAFGSSRFPNYNFYCNKNIKEKKTDDAAALLQAEC